MTNHNEALTTQVYTFASELYAYGVREVVISPGSRSTPLAIAFEAHPKITTWIHPDERSAAFFALGLIKGSDKPVAILCTSGTAAANYTPAIAESQISRLPLIVLTSDRPHELRSVGAPQAINQVNMFNNYVNYEFDMPIADNSKECLATIQYQLQIASQYLYGPHKGPIHFNLPFRDPLTPDLTATHLLTSHHKLIPRYQKTIDITDIKEVLARPKGMIIVGDMQHQEIDQLLTYSTIFDLPILADPLSKIRKYQHPNVITTYDLLFRAGLKPHVDFVIRVGKPVISKLTNQWLKASDAFQIIVQNNDKMDVFPNEPNVAYDMSANDFFRSLMNEDSVNRKSWLTYWHDLEHHARVEIQHYIASANDESGFVAQVLDKIPDHHALFVSNSMPIRDIDNLFVNQNIDIYANRGANGIDGVTSTALGMAVHKDITLLIGDLSFYHDMNGLLMSKLNDIHMNIILLNNDGGGIFSYLPQKDSASDYFERLFGTPTGLNFEHAALMYDFNFVRLDNISDFAQLSLSTISSTIYELQTNRQNNYQQHQKLYKKLSEIVHAKS
ncbi:2-succinyl-5-enolpyruvyl-6-hydroxy-3-cyclohexene-1-carboxylic-acid synthase [Staphylococcus simiae]|uniref:2-succinyl-5-enolpyruvyl-6-hydroxy-3- cyclohexene-1-carboxylic-acid synthase n=1 Tax=Staphylococcus simiae TaxID=308354 RepID=UPI001A9755D9|nr:2-succinyl-5-enolpyruvyl-6-hydroxy-3-cyclohexene-1-carboxylic-acid synthase [Staphylococcus simiae]MBO1198951.1 2-succinyl-5-enolpyruvyl-6-hydroxy-3-cyclohexene-1-carboxylic-acid synthase [Staphylococcus simiae]MBO1201148.1 2-succinyl-5-enolpyruvyl-6-hydroxy-3-cyclohexene-1-carboxylic-acid synthase [Staphylococcus simiae]MBO1203804.1 2-succinyl-5-enolpyruvyl-6-hydroxy-3-cyclohexene-1-carboxylic-acid synthase [Staphylococcus simiae]MBO1210797.1 2-succinyl-5-enolpyruvyl-6-hydroxy-3-cyclohexene